MTLTPDRPVTPDSAAHAAAPTVTPTAAPLKPAPRRKLRLAFTGTTQKDMDDVLAIREHLKLPHAVVLYEQFVVDPAHAEQSPTRILGYAREHLQREIDRLTAAGMKPLEGMLIANVEDGHPLDGQDIKTAVENYLEDLASFKTTTAAYGLVKRNIYGTEQVPTATGPALVADLDEIAGLTTLHDSHILAELYAPHKSGTAQGSPIHPLAQRAWTLDLVSRCMRIAAPTAKTVALICPFYPTGIALSADDARIMLEAAAHCDEIALWCHIGTRAQGGIPRGLAALYAEAWARHVEKLP